MGLLESEAWVWGNLSESLISLGRWDEALEAAARPRPRGAVRPTRRRRPQAGLHRPRPGRDGRGRPAARRGPRRLRHARPMPQYRLPLAALALGIAAAEGRVQDARAEFAECWTRACRPAPSATAGRCCCPPPGGGRRPRAAGRRGGTDRGPGTARGHRQDAHHRRTGLARPREVGPRRTPPGRGPGHPGALDGGGHRLRVPGAALRTRPGPAPARRRPPGHRR